MDLAEWKLLMPHLNRDALVVVAPGLDLLEAGLAVAQDEVQTIQGWLSQNRLAKPSAAQIETWNESPDRKFRILIVQPYVLIQEIIQ